jgi:hypothetical protein
MYSARIHRDAVMAELNNAHARFKELLRSTLRRLDQAFWARDDDIARRMGWQISRARFGVRRYRDPRFDGPIPVPEPRSHEESALAAGGGGAYREDLFRSGEAFPGMSWRVPT